MKKIRFNVIMTFVMFAFLTSANAQQSTMEIISEVYEDGVVDQQEALKLIKFPDPTFSNSQSKEMDPETLKDMGFVQVYSNEEATFTTRDKIRLFAYKYPKKSNTTIILLHGVLSSAFMMNMTAGLLRNAINAEVYAVDMRGHGRSEGVPGDTDYVGQYSDDLADIVNAIKKDKPKNKIILAGHSMGGGIILRYSMNPDSPKVNGYLLMAPLLGHNSPTLPTDGNEASPNSEEPFLKINIARIIGIKTMKLQGNNSYDSLRVLFFNLPKEMPLRNYSYRANESMAPEDYTAGLKSVKVPLIVLVGSKDEAFVPGKFKSAVEENSSGKVYVIENATHNGIRRSNKTMSILSDWYKRSIK